MCLIKLTKLKNQECIMNKIKSFIFTELDYRSISTRLSTSILSSCPIPGARIALIGGHGRHQELDEDDDVSDARGEIVTDNPDTATIVYCMRGAKFEGGMSTEL